MRSCWTCFIDIQTIVTSLTFNCKSNVFVSFCSGQITDRKYKGNMIEESEKVRTNISSWRGHSWELYTLWYSVPLRSTRAAVSDTTSYVWADSCRPVTSFTETKTPFLIVVIFGNPAYYVLIGFGSGGFKGSKRSYMFRVVVFLYSLKEDLLQKRMFSVLHFH